MLIVRIKVRISVEEIAWDIVNLLDSATDWCMPSVVTPRIQESLIDRASNKGLLKDMFSIELFGLKHLFQRVGVVFKPELIIKANILYWKLSVG